MKPTKDLDLPYVPLSAPRVDRQHTLEVVTDGRCKCCIWDHLPQSTCWLAESGQKPPQWETEETCPYQEALLPRLASQGE